MASGTSLPRQTPTSTKTRGAAEWFEESTNILFAHRYNPRSNFASQNYRDYRSLGAFGTGCMFIDELFGEKGIRYKSIGLGQIYIAENHQGIVDKVTRRFKLTARQAVDKWGRDRLPDAITSALATNPEQEFEFIHAVRPRKDRDPGRADFMGMPWAGFYVSLTGKMLVEEHGYETFPYAISRYEQADDEVYGRSPAMDALPAIKTLNEEKRVLLKQGHRALDPVLLVHDDGIIDGFSMRPGAMNAGGVSADGRPLVHALPSGQVQVGKELMDDERKLINDIFLVSLFQILTENPQMTATEVLERTREKGILMAPTVGRQQTEKLEPMIERELDILSRQRVLPPMPGILREARGEYKIVHDSPLSRAQRAEEAAGIQRVLEQGLAYFNATQDPSVFDYIDIDKVMPAIADIQGVPPSWMRSLEQVIGMRQKRDQDKRDQQMIQAAPAAAAVMKAAAASQAAQGGGQ
jgi:hypothetical protein